MFTQLSRRFWHAPRAARCLGTLVVAEHQNNRLNPSTLATINAALQLGQPITALLLGQHTQEAADTLAKTGIAKVMQTQHAAFNHSLAEPSSVLLQTLHQKLQFDYMLAPSTTFGKNLLPRAAALLGRQMLSDVTQIVDPDTFVRPAYAGNALFTMRFSSPGLRMMTIRGSSFTAAPTNAEQPAEQKMVSQEDMQPALAVAEAGTSRWVSEEATKTERPDLASARVVVCGGRAIKNAQDFKMIESLADALGGAVGASRAVVDAGIVSNDMQVGQTGKAVAPDLYIGAGVSGAIQHFAGIKDSKTIVAINNDEECAMVKEADYALIGDVYTLVPELESAIRQLKKAQK